MAFPRISDDGRTVELDLHGAGVLESEQLIRRLVALASRRGRGTVRVVHGLSTSESHSDRPTIRGRLLEMLETGVLDEFVTDWLTFEGATTLSLGISTATDRTRIVLRDVI